jgi:putative RNA 2'-phosphotransferase
MVLRHKPEEIGLKLDSAGWANVDELLAAMKGHGTPISHDQLVSIVETDNKKRYQFSEDGGRIRASQGHSIKIDLGYENQQPPEFLYHGTASRFISSIREIGLRKGDRHQVHLSTSKDVATSVGSRYGKPVILTIESARMHREGHEFCCSENNVWLTEHVPVQYILFPED